MHNNNKPVTLNELADLYDKHHPEGRPARTFPFSVAVEWAKNRKDLFTETEEGFIMVVSKEAHDA